MHIYPQFTEQWRLDLISNPPNASRYFSKEEWEHIVLYELCSIPIPDRGMSGKKHKTETKLKMSLAALDKPKSESHKQAMRKPKTPEHKLKLAKANLGKIRSEESKQKAKDSMKSKGMQWWNNGIRNMRVGECPGIEWKRGRLFRKI